MPKARLLIFNDGYLWEDLADIPHDNLDVTCVHEGNREQLLAQIADYEAYIPTLRIRIDTEVLDKAARLRCIASSATGTDHLDLPAIEQRGITLFTLKHDRELLDNITTTAEL